MKFKLTTFLYSSLFSITSLLSFPQITLAQLRLGTGVQPGLEGYFLEYQHKALPLKELRGASACSIGFGASCNKTGAVIQKIIKEHSGLDYQELLIQAAGGAENYQKFTEFYANPSAVSMTPYSSFWRDNNKYILDSHEYSGIGTLNGLEVAHINDITSKFKYSPTTLKQESITLRQGLVELKLSYGLTLMEEALKIPNIKQKIAEISLDENEASYHQQQFQKASSALNGQSFENKKNALFNILSRPYTEIAAPLNRPPLNITEAITNTKGISLEGEVTSLVAITEEGEESFLFGSFDEVIEDATTVTSLYTLAGLGGITLLLLLLEDGSADFVSYDIISSQSLLESPITLSNSNSANYGANSIDNNEELITSKVPESSAINIFWLFLSLFFLFKPKKVIM